MKYLLFLAVGLFSISAQAQQQMLSGMETNGGAQSLQKITLSGTVEVQGQTPSAVRARVSTLNNKRVYTEFGVSKNDYELVLDINGSGVVELAPKSASAGLPTIQVVQVDNVQSIQDSKLNVGDFGATVTSPATGNLFEGLSGILRGRLAFKGAIIDGVFKKYSVSGLAFGTNQGGSSTTALLRFKVVTVGSFTPKP